MDWSEFDPDGLFAVIREQRPAHEAERTIRALENVLAAARSDPESLEHLLVAVVSLIALERGETPRTVLEQLFRRSVSDAEWRRDYQPLFD